MSHHKGVHVHYNMTLSQTSTASIFRKHLRFDDKLTSFEFRVFDKDGNGFITIDELEMTMLSLGETLTPSELQEMMDEVDSDRDGKVSYRQRS